MDCARCGKHLKTLDQTSIATHYASEACKAKAKQLQASGKVQKISSFFKPKAVVAAAAAGAGAAAAPTFQAGEEDEDEEGEVIGQPPERMDVDIDGETPSFILSSLSFLTRARVSQPPPTPPFQCRLPSPASPTEAMRTHLGLCRMASQVNNRRQGPGRQRLRTVMSSRSARSADAAVR